MKVKIFIVEIVYFCPAVILVYSNKKPWEMMMSDSDEELDALIKKAVHKTNKPSKTQWNCPSCTYANHKDLLECEMCEKPRSLTKSESGHMKSKLSIAISTIKSSETKVKLTSGK